MDTRIDFKTYQGGRPPEAHGHAQMVLALEGGMELEAAGRAEKLDSGRAVFLAPGLVHSQQALSRNRFLVLDCPWDALDSPLAEHLAERVFLDVPPAARHLLAFAEAAQMDRLGLAALSGPWLQLLAASLAVRPFCLPKSRIARLSARVEAALDYPWTVEKMAENAGVSPSRLHAVFQAELGQTPQAWLAGRRMDKARRWLALTDLPLAQVSQMAGYSDQSAFTKAMRRLTGRTPAAYRREQRESGPKKQ